MEHNISKKPVLIKMSNKSKKSFISPLKKTDSSTTKIKTGIITIM